MAKLLPIVALALFSTVLPAAANCSGVAPVPPFTANESPMRCAPGVPLKATSGAVVRPLTSSFQR